MIKIIIKKVLIILLSVVVNVFIIAFIANLNGKTEKRIDEESKKEKIVFKEPKKKEIKEKVREDEPIKQISKIEESEIMPISETVFNPPALSLNLDSFVAGGLNIGRSGLKRGHISSKNFIYTEEMVDKMPEIISKGSIEYPEFAEEREIEGSVNIKILINEKGDVLKVVLLNSDPKGVFDKNVVDGVLKWKFKPAEYKEKSVKIWLKEKIDFRING